MIVRALDSDDDWQFGKGKNDYRANNDAIAQSIKTRLSMVLGDCFFAVSEGIDWFNQLGGKNQLALNLSINATILNTEGVTGILQTSLSVSPVTRGFAVQYKVQTVYSTLTGIFQYDLNGVG